MAELKDCFVIAPIGEEESEIRKRSDLLLKYVIDPATEACGYKATRADKIAEPGIITSQVIQHIVDDPMVIADLTGRNPNVFYELAIRHVLKKPFIQIIKKGEQLPFDVAGTRTIFIDHKDLDSVEEAKKTIIAQIKSLEAEPSKLETPISISLNLQLLKQSENPEQRSLADVLSAATEIRNSLATIEEKLNLPVQALNASILHDIGYYPVQNAKYLSYLPSHSHIRPLFDLNDKDQRYLEIEEELANKEKRIEELENCIIELQKKANEND